MRFKLAKKLSNSLRLKNYSIIEFGQGKISSTLETPIERDIKTMTP